MKDKAKHGMEQADHKVDEGVDAIEKSRVGKNLPTHIEKVEFKDIVYGLLFLIIILTIPVYLLISTFIEANKEKGTLLSKICYYSIMFTGVLGITFDAVVIMMKKKSMLKVTMVIKAIKAITIVLLMFTLSANGKVAKCLQIFYLLGVMAVDALFLYYAAIYLKRISTHEYDEHGKSGNR